MNEESQMIERYSRHIDILERELADTQRQLAQAMEALENIKDKYSSAATPMQCVKCIIVATAALRASPVPQDENKETI